MTKIDWPKGELKQWRRLIPLIENDDRFSDLEAEVQTDKRLVKLNPCQFCRRPLVVSTFYVLAWAKCSPCAGAASATREAGSVEVVQQGRTEPRLAADLAKVLINPQFAFASCPIDGEHEMELKSVHWSDHYGPHEYRMVDGKLTPVQIAPGESVMHQCLQCNAVVSYSTTAVTQFSRINEPKRGKNSNVWTSVLETRDDTLDDWDRKFNDHADEAAAEAAGGDVYGSLP
jgi:hypothetical protein